MPPSNTILYDIAKEILAAVVAGFTAAGEDLPARQFVSNGSIADDCQQLAVQVVSIGQGFPGEENLFHQKLPASRPRFVDVAVRLTRDCQPGSDKQGQAPPYQDLEAAGRQLLIDGWILRQSVVKGVQVGAIAEMCDSITVGRCNSFGPQGGVAGWELNVSAQVGG